MENGTLCLMFDWVDDGQVRKGDVVAIYEDKVLSDDQALRYIGKQALMTGRWMAHSAELKNRGKSVGNEGLHEDPDGDRQGLKSIHSAGTTTDANSNCVMSCSPIFIMQDLYCIGCAQPICTTIMFIHSCVTYSNQTRK